MNKPYFISEVSSNHSQDLERSKEFIRKSAEIGCDAVKFQLFKIDQLFAPEILSKSKMHADRKQWELPVEFLPELSACSKEHSIDFSCTPFYLKAVEELEPYVDFYKIASYELLWDDLIIECARTNKPLVLSTGMATLDEIGHAVSTFNRHSSAELTLLHTISAYPTPIHEANVSAIETLRSKFGCQVGLSDHSVSPAVLLRAIHRWQASAVEFHLDLDEHGEEYQTGHCWLPHQIESTIKLVRDGFSADGNGEKAPVPSELPDREWRADPADGLRPFKHVRKTFNG
ncbi:N-acetylneuraminate synthase family protein [Thalassotalea euphylliae]|uniref:N-acetylneuraminate synthase family protein n=1 Tax=Thalassotalea euphylliae TaxID=1655234 RepID=UPI00362C1E97